MRLSQNCVLCGREIQQGNNASKFLTTDDVCTTRNGKPTTCAIPTSIARGQHERMMISSHVALAVPRSSDAAGKDNVRLR